MICEIIVVCSLFHLLTLNMLKPPSSCEGSLMITLLQTDCVQASWHTQCHPWTGTLGKEAAARYV